MFLIFVFVISCFIVRYVYKLSKYYTYFNYLGRGVPRGIKVPGPRGYPLFGNALDFSLDDYVENGRHLSLMAKKYGPVFRVKIFNRDIVYLNSVSVIKCAFVNNKCVDNFSDRPATVFSELFEFGDVVTQKHGDSAVYQEVRRIFVQGLHKCGESGLTLEKLMAQDFTSFSNKIEEFGGEEFCVNDLVAEALRNSISSFLIGKPIHSEEIHRCYDEFGKTSEALLHPVLSTILMTLPFVRYIPSRVKTLLDRYQEDTGILLQYFFHTSKKTFVPGHTRGLVDFYLNAQHDDPNSEVLTEKQIQHCILNVLIAGVNTTQSILCGIILILMNHQDKQKRIQTELDAMPGIPGLSERQDLPYMEAFIMEALRYLNISPLFVPRASKEDFRLRGFNIAKGSLVMLNAYHLLHNEDVWGDPWAFRPERFLGENGHVIPRGHVLRRNLINFGLGRRRCPGESLATSRIFLFLTTILKHWTILPPKDRTPSCDPRSDDFEVFLVSNPKPFRCIMKRRVS